MSNNSMTSEPTTPNHIQQRLFAGGFPVSQSQTRASAKGSHRLHNLVCGTNSIESFAYYDRDTSSWKTCQQSFLTDLESFLETWPRQGITANGVAFQRRILEPVTREIGGGLLPTPKATEIKETPQQWAKRSAKPANKNFGPSLNVKLQILNELGEVPNQVARSYFLPTPTARDYKDSGPNMNYKKAAKEGRLPGVIVGSRSNKTGNDTYLNPRFVEEMMGYPIGYTEVQD